MLSFCTILRIPTQERRLGVILLELYNLIQSFLFDEDPQGPTESDLHDVRLEVVIGKSEVEEGFGVLLDARNQRLFEEVVAEHLHVLDGVLVGRHRLVQTLVVVQVVLLVLLAQSDC